MAYIGAATNRLGEDVDHAMPRDGAADTELCHDVGMTMVRQWLARQSLAELDDLLRSLSRSPG